MILRQCLQESSLGGQQPGGSPKGRGATDPGSARASGHGRLPRGPGRSVTPFRKDAGRGALAGDHRPAAGHPGQGPLTCLQRTHPGQGERPQLPSLKQGCGRPHEDPRAGRRHARPRAACPARTQTPYPLPWGTDDGQSGGATGDPPLSRADAAWGGHGLPLRSWAAGSRRPHPAVPALPAAGEGPRPPELGTDPGRDGMHATPSGWPCRPRLAPGGRGRGEGGRPDGTPWALGLGPLPIMTQRPRTRGPSWWLFCAG